MKKLSMIRLVCLVVIFILVSQFLSLGAFGSTGLNGHAQNEQNGFFLPGIHADFTVIQERNGKTSASAAMERITRIFSEQMQNIALVEEDTSEDDSFIDLRKEIQNKKMSYFHGSKYKERSHLIA